MTLNRLTVAIATLFAALLVAALVLAAGAASSSASPTHSMYRSPFQVGTLVPWSHKQPVYAKVVYHPHTMCPELRHPAPAMKQSPKF